MALSRTLKKIISTSRPVQVAYSAKAHQVIDQEKTTLWDKLASVKDAMA